jgi:hypothetical protein
MDEGMEFDRQWCVSERRLPVGLAYSKNQRGGPTHLEVLSRLEAGAPGYPIHRSTAVIGHPSINPLIH